MQVDGDAGGSPLVRFTFLSDLLGGDEDLLREVVNVYQGSAGELLGDLERLVASGELLAAKAAAHSLKGASASAGAERMRALAESLEHALKADDAAAASEVLRRLRAQLRPTLDEFSRRFASEYGRPR